MKKLSLIICILWMGFIFYNSSKTGEQSNNITISIVESLTKDKEIIENNNINSNISSENDEEVLGEDIAKNNISRYDIKKTIYELNIMLRKSAHALEFLVLAILVAWVMFSHGVRGKNVVVYVLFVVLFYAVTDEFHQLYVAGRTSRVEDVLIDFIGGVIGVLLYYFTYYLIGNKIKIKRYKEGCDQNEKKVVKG